MKLIRLRGCAASAVVLAVLSQATPAAQASASPDTAATKTGRGRNPVAFELCVPEGTALAKCQALGVPRVFEVPGGHTLVIEQVSGECGGDGGLGVRFRAGVIAETNAITLVHWIVGVTSPGKPAGQIPLTNTRIYADAGSLVTMDVSEVPALSGRFCRATFSGQLLR